MKRIIFTIALIGSFSSVFSQVTLTLDEYNGLNNKIDSLESGWEQADKDYTQQKKDSEKRIDSLTAHSQKLKKEKNTLFKEKNILRNKNETLLADSRKLESRIDSLKVKQKESHSSHQGLEAKLNTKKEELDTFKKQKRENEKTQYEKGKKEVLSTVTSSYAELSFDEMINASSQKQVKRDLNLIVDKELKEKLKDLNIYFSARQVLAQKFDQQEVQVALKKTKTIKEDSRLVKDLIENLDNYKLRNEGLRDALEKIQDIDQRFIANTDNDQKDKEKDILAQVAWYFYNYEINNLQDYPYLSAIIIEIMQIKHRDANTDISPILKKL